MRASFLCPVTAQLRGKEKPLPPSVLTQPSHDLRQIFRREVVDFIIGATRTKGTELTESLADYLEPRIVHNTLTASPFRGSDVVLLFDKCTIDPTPERRGLINVVTAPARVLRCLEGLPEEAIPLILQKRATLSGPIKATTAWLVLVFNE